MHPEDAVVRALRVGYNCNLSIEAAEEKNAAC
jgi:hypothetical protein